MMTIHVNSMSFTHFLFLLAQHAAGAQQQAGPAAPPLRRQLRGQGFFEVKTATIAAMMARVTGRPVKFMQDRLDNIANGDHHGSDRYYEVELAAKADGTLLSTRYKVVDNYGAYIQFRRGPARQLARPGRRPLPHEQHRLRPHRGVDQQVPAGAPTGASAPRVGNWILERMVDLMARELDMDPVDIRRMNFIQPDQFP